MSQDHTHPTISSPRIVSVEADSIASDLDWVPGDRLISINGKPVEDVLDLLFHEQNEFLEIRLLKQNGSEELFEIEKDDDLELGIELEPLDVRKCRNNCLFCFIHQQPKGLRHSLYIKDEDYRFSFLHGNYVTLSHITEHEIERIIRLNLSPMYISVHATDDTIRRTLLGVQEAASITPLMQKLLSGKISIHAQIVICPGYNDGTVLDQTLRDLEGLGEGILSVALVPVGLTCHRRNLPELIPVSPADSRKTVALIEKKQRQWRTLRGRNWCYLADEYYILSGKKLPPTAEYDDFPQIENGIGMVRSFIDDWDSDRQKKREKLPIPTTIITGKLFAPILKKLVTSSFFPGEITILAVENTFFGPTVTVTGLLSGCDILKALKHDGSSNRVLIPDVCLNSDNLFLDDMTIDELEKASHRQIMVVSTDGRKLYHILKGSR